MPTATADQHEVKGRKWGGQTSARRAGARHRSSVAGRPRSDPASPSAAVSSLARAIISSESVEMGTAEEVRRPFRTSCEPVMPFGTPNGELHAVGMKTDEKGRKFFSTISVFIFYYGKQERMQNNRE